MLNKKICVIGLGYIGLPTASLLANYNYQVHGVDINKKAVDIINSGKAHIIEPDLDDFVKRAIKNKTLIASTEPKCADIFIIAVPTPFHEGYVPNTDFIENAALSIAPFIKKNNIVILESTSPVGTTEILQKILKEAGVNIHDIHIAYCPERVLPGNIMKELVENDRIIGGIKSESSNKVKKFYETFVKGDLFTTDSRTAEMVKLTENSFRDVNIAFANELSILCDNLDINESELIELANKHPRVNILNPGPGVGGHCIAVDPWFIIHKDPENSKIIKTARELNLYKTEWVIQKIISNIKSFEKNNKKPPIISCFGLAFKPDIDDLRESPAVNITKNLIDNGFQVLTVEPNIKHSNDFKLVSIDEAINKSDIFVMLVAHKEFQNLDIETDLDFCGVL